MKEIAVSESSHGPYDSDSKEVVASPVPVALLTTPQGMALTVGCRRNGRPTFLRACKVLTGITPRRDQIVSNFALETTLCF